MTVASGAGNRLCLVDQCVRIAAPGESQCLGLRQQGERQRALITVGTCLDDCGVDDRERLLVDADADQRDCGAQPRIRPTDGTTVPLMDGEHEIGILTQDPHLEL